MGGSISPGRWAAASSRPSSPRSASASSCSSCIAAGRRNRSRSSSTSSPGRWRICQACMSSSSVKALQELLDGPSPILALAPMQEVTNGAFWTLVHEYGGADVYWTEYFRVHSSSTPEPRILDAITRNPTGRPVIAQMIGNDVAELVRTAKFLQQYPVAAIDLNLGCPAPIVYRKCAGGGLLREP